MDILLLILYFFNSYQCFSLKTIELLMDFFKSAYLNQFFRIMGYNTLFIMILNQLFH